MMKDKILKLSIKFYRSYWARNVARRMKNTFIYTAVKAYKKLKEAKEKKKQLVELRMNTGGINNLVKNLLFSRVKTIELNQNKESKVAYFL